MFPDDPKANMSPAETLRHEMGHAYNDLIEGTWKQDRKKEPINTDMYNLEEENVINEYDIAGGINRENHRGLPMTGTSNPNAKDGVLPEMKNNSNGTQ